MSSDILLFLSVISDFRLSISLIRLPFYTTKKRMFIVHSSNKINKLIFEPRSEFSPIALVARWIAVRRTRLFSAAYHFAIPSPALSFAKRQFVSSVHHSRCFVGVIELVDQWALFVRFIETVKCFWFFNILIVTVVISISSSLIVKSDLSFCDDIFSKYSDSFFKRDN